MSAPGRSQALAPEARSAQGRPVSARHTLGLLAATLVLGLAACAEQEQGGGAVKKTDAKAWEGSQSASYTAQGWKTGDKDSWEAQLKARAQRGQNEYSRVAAAPQ
jgi:hypothetical protein